MSQLVRILIVDDHPLVRAGLACQLKTAAGIEVVGEAEDGPSAIEMAKRTSPDVVLMDYRMPGMNGAEATRTLLSNVTQTTVIAVSSDAHPNIRRTMEQAGASAFFLKGDDHRSLLTLIRRAVASN